MKHEIGDCINFPSPCSRYLADEPQAAVRAGSLHGHVSVRLHRVSSLASSDQRTFFPPVQGVSLEPLGEL